MIAARLSPGAISESSSSHLPPSETAKNAREVPNLLGFPRRGGKCLAVCLAVKESAKLFPPSHPADRRRAVGRAGGVAGRRASGNATGGRQTAIAREIAGGSEKPMAQA
jgi:hypothetical protein